MAPDDVRRLFPNLAADRREFLVRLLTGVGMAYVAPVVASFSLDGLVIPAAAQGGNICTTVASNLCYGPSGVAIEKTALPASVHPGDTVTYQITIQNCGTKCQAGNLLVQDPIPAGTTFVSAQQLGGPSFVLALPQPGDGPPAAFVASLNGTELAALQIATFEVVVRVDEP